MGCICLKNMAFYGHHGDLASEREQGQRFFVDLVLAADLSKAGQSDNLEDSINYVEIYNMVAEIVEGEPCHLLERLGTLIIDKVWQSFPGVVGLSVTVRKPSVPIKGILDYVEVTMDKGQISCSPTT